MDGAFEHVSSRRREGEAAPAGALIPHQGSFGQVSDSTLVVSPAVARSQVETDQRVYAPLSDTEIRRPGEPDTVVEPGAPPANRRFFGTTHINPERYSRDLTRVAQEILQHLAAADGVELEVTVEISATRTDGFTDDKVRTVSENARTLKFDLDQYGFESD